MEAGEESSGFQGIWRCFGEILTFDAQSESDARRAVRQFLTGPWAAGGTLFHLFREMHPRQRAGLIAEAQDSRSLMFGAIHYGWVREARPFPAGHAELAEGVARYWGVALAAEAPDPAAAAAMTGSIVAVRTLGAVASVSWESLGGADGCRLMQGIVALLNTRGLNWRAEALRMLYAWVMCAPQGGVA
jgi:hypothetical protein